MEELAWHHPAMGEVRGLIWNSTILQKREGEKLLDLPVKCLGGRLCGLSHMQRTANPRRQKESHFKDEKTETW